MSRRIIGVRGSPSHGRPRLEIETLSAGDGPGSLALARFRETDASESFRARLAWGNFVTEVVLDLQRDAAQPSHLVAAEFDRRASLHRRLDDTPAVATVYEIAPSLSSQYGLPLETAAELPPSILCRHARHALAPLCPACARPLYLAVAPTVDGRRRLTCLAPKCETSLDSSRAPDVLEASVRNDPSACRSCPHRDRNDTRTCLENAQFLNFFPGRYLILERFDLALDEYLGWHGLAQAPRGRVSAWARWQEHRVEGPGPGTDEGRLSRLSRIAAIFLDLLEGVGRIHELSEVRAHLNLEPQAVGLNLYGSLACAKLVDLGQAVADEARAPLRSPLYQNGLFAAPEMNQPNRPVEHDRVTAWVQDGALIFSLPSSLGDQAPMDPRFVQGDKVQLTLAEGIRVPARILQAKRLGDTLFLRARASVELESSRRMGGRLRVWKALGPAADVYSLGLILWALVANRPDVSVVRGQLPGVAAWLRVQTRALVRPGFERVIELLESSDPLLRLNFGDVLPSLRADFGEWAYLAAELIDVALRCCVRGVPDFGVALHRGDDRSALLAPVAEHFRHIQAAIQAETERVRAGHLGGRQAAEAIRRLIAGVQAVPITTSPTISRPSYDAARLRAHLMLTPTDFSTGALIRRYGGRADWVLEHLRDFLSEVETDTVRVERY